MKSISAIFTTNNKIIDFWHQADDIDIKSWIECESVVSVTQGAVPCAGAEGGEGGGTAARKGPG